MKIKCLYGKYNFISVLTVGTTKLREDEAYVRDYTLIANSICVLILPASVMLVSTLLIVSRMIQPTGKNIYTTISMLSEVWLLWFVSAMIYSSDQEQSRKKRNRSITLMLIGKVITQRKIADSTWKYDKGHKSSRLDRQCRKIKVKMTFVCIFRNHCPVLLMSHRRGHHLFVRDVSLHRKQKKVTVSELGKVRATKDQYYI